jgi:hypothetical protein
MTKYVIITNLMDEEQIQWDDDGTIRIIPSDPANSDYQRYLRWVEDPEAEENGTIS